jgi:hypothetical protein
VHSPDQTADRVGDAMSEFGVKEDKFRVNVNTTDATIEPVLRHCYYPLRILRVLP